MAPPRIPKRRTEEGQDIPILGIQCEDADADADDTTLHDNDDDEVVVVVDVVVVWPWTNPRTKIIMPIMIVIFINSGLPICHNNLESKLIGRDLLWDS